MLELEIQEAVVALRIDYQRSVAAIETPDEYADALVDVAFAAYESLPDPVKVSLQEAREAQSPDVRAKQDEDACGKIATFSFAATAVQGGGAAGTATYTLSAQTLTTAGAVAATAWVVCRSAALKRIPADFKKAVEDLPNTVGHAGEGIASGALRTVQKADENLHVTQNVKGLDRAIKRLKPRF